MLETSDEADGEVLHREFHEAVLRSTGNTFLVTLGSILHRFFWEFGYLEGGVRKPPEPRLASSHRAIVALMRSGDPGEIQHVIDLHLSPHVSGDDHRPNASAASQPASSKNREG
jgi:GntR family transcriptional regulator, transcriptional repressor for pyruvate dehydrogenase complex